MAFSIWGVSTGCTSQNNNFRSVDTPEFSKLIQDSTVQVVDVRTPDEYSKGHIARAVNMDVLDSRFDNMIQSLDKNRPVAVYCRSGRRSKDAAKKLAEKGFTGYDLDKGIENWAYLQYPLVIP